jgi:diaminohydroxyphosphoribosylaminopyrimidine deaminase/5-amino-6-(5-phosphoribosylamino)uracil reductase
MFSAQDQWFMARALQLAEQGLYTTDPNPRVGCVLVRDGVIVGEGWHRKAGQSHAEVEALQQAGERARGSTVYLTLEPCSHHGRTPPCADALIKAGVAKVIIATADPNPLVNGQGMRKLQAAGIAIALGLMQDEVRVLNAGFMKRMSSGLPWVRVKLAASLDGRTALANGVSQWISSAESRADVQHWRARSSAILTGLGTVLADDPQLTVRDNTIDLMERQPLRVICDSQLRTPSQARLLQGDGVLIYTCAHSRPRGYAEVVQVASDDKGHVDIVAVLKDLALRGCNEVLVEAGATLSGRLFELGLVDELLLYVAPVLLGHDARPMLRLPLIESMNERMTLKLLDSQPVGADLRLRYQVQR